MTTSIKKRMSPSEFRDHLLAIVKTAGVSTDNSGIGHYEYWGAKCFDKGHDFLTYDGQKTLTYATSDFTARTIDAIWGCACDFNYTFIEGDLDLTVQVHARVREDRVFVTITELD